MERRQFLELGIGAAIVTLSGCKRESGAPVRNVDFHIDWTPGVDYIGFYAAKEYGRFTEANFNANIVPGQGAEAAAQLLASGTIGVGTTTIDAYLNAYRKGLFDKEALPRVAAVIFQKNPVVLLSSASNPVVRPQDLLGRKIGFSMEGSVTYRQLRQLVSNWGKVSSDNISTSVDPRGPVGADRVKLVEVQYQGPQLLRNGEVDSIIAYATDAPVELELSEFEFDLRYVSDFGLDMAGMCICVGSKLIDEIDTEQLVRAACQGWDDVRRDPTRAIEMFVANFPEISKERATLALAQTLPLLPPIDGVGAYTDETKLRAYIDRANTILNDIEEASLSVDAKQLVV